MCWWKDAKAHKRPEARCRYKKFVTGKDIFYPLPVAGCVANLAKARRGNIPSVEASITKRKFRRRDFPMSCGLQNRDLHVSDLARKFAHNIFGLPCPPFCKMKRCGRQLSNKREGTDDWRMNFQGKNSIELILLIARNFKMRVRLIMVMKLHLDYRKSRLYTLDKSICFLVVIFRYVEAPRVYFPVPQTVRDFGIPSKSY